MRVDVTLERLYQLTFDVMGEDLQIKSNDGFHK